MTFPHLFLYFFIPSVIIIKHPASQRGTDCDTTRSTCSDIIVLIFMANLHGRNLFLQDLAFYDVLFTLGSQTSDVYKKWFHGSNYSCISLDDADLPAIFDPLLPDVLCQLLHNFD